MTTLQKVIKYGAIAFGFYLAFVILSAIIFGIMAIFGVSIGLDAYKTYTTTNEVTTSFFEETFQNVKSLEIKLDVSKLNIKNGNEFKVQVTNPTNKFYCEMDGDTLKIKDKRKNVNFFNFSAEVIPEIIVYVPENQKLDNIEINAGISESYIEKLVANEIDIETGVGKFLVGNLEADLLNIKGGAGEANIENSTVNEIELEAGVGKFIINSEILEEAEIKAGVGQLIVNLQGEKHNYKVKTNTGLGRLLVDGKESQDNQIIGDGDSYIKVEAGVGEVRVDFIENSI